MTNAICAMCRFVSRGPSASRNDFLPGAAGVLLNQTHLFHDLFLFIDAQEKRMFEAIDGRRSISEIVDKVKEKGTSLAAFSRSSGGTTRWYLIRRRLSDKTIYPVMLNIDSRSSILDPRSSYSVWIYESFRDWFRRA